jgi:hypothetical protein
MKEGFKVFLVFLGIIILFLVLDYSSLLWQGFVGPKRENVRREIFEKTRSYNEAKLQDLVRYRLQYLRAETEEEKEALASTIRHMFANYDDKNLTPELREFLKLIKYGG